MPKYIVEVREVHVQAVYVLAENEADAIEKVGEGQGEHGDCEYSHTMDKENWTVQEETFDEWLDSTGFPSPIRDLDESDRNEVLGLARAAFNLEESANGRDPYWVIDQWFRNRS